MELRGADLDRQRREVVAGIRRDRPLHEPEIARADHPDPLARATAASRIQRSVASPSARSSNGLNCPSEPNVPAHALDHDLEAALGQQPAEEQPDQLPAPVRRADQYRRLWPGARSRGRPSGRRAAPRRRPSPRAGRARTRRRCVSARGSRIRRARISLPALIATIVGAGAVASLAVPDRRPPNERPDLAPHPPSRTRRPPRRRARRDPRRAATTTRSPPRSSRSRRGGWSAGSRSGSRPGSAPPRAAATGSARTSSSRSRAG